MRADYEVGANIPCDDLGGIESMLREMGADDPGERHQENFYSSPRVGTSARGTRRSG